MLYAVASLALALAPTPNTVLLAGPIKCDSDFTACNNNVDVNEAKLHHIQALKATNGILAHKADCTGSKVLAAGATFNAKVDLYALGEQTVTLSVSSVKGTRGTGVLKASGVADLKCDGITFEQLGSKIVLDKPLHEHCPALSQSISLSHLEYCADQQALHAKVGTPFVDLHVVAGMVDWDAEQQKLDEATKKLNEQGEIDWDKAGDALDKAGDALTQKVQSSCLCVLAAGQSMTFDSISKLGFCQTDADCSAPAKCEKGSAVSGACPAVSKNDGGSGSKNGGDNDSKKGGGSGGCFAKDSTTACLFASAADETCSPVLMTDLVPGDLVLGRDGATTVVAVQHKAADTNAEMLTFHTAEATVSMTPDHGLFVDGALVAASDAKVGSQLSSGVVIKRITKSEAKIINAVTVDGTIVADGVLAASNPMWIAALTVDAPLMRAVVNAALYAAGDVDSVGAGFSIVLGKTMSALFVAAVAVKALQARSASK